MNARELLQKADEVNVYAEEHGSRLVSFEDAAILGAADSIEGKIDTGMRKLNPDGTLARSKARTVAINLEAYTNNRFRTKRAKDGKELQIVIDYRAIVDLQMGRTIYTSKVPVHVIIRDEAGNLKYVKTITVSDSEFVSEFTNKLGVNEMLEILPLLNNAGNEVSESEMPI